MEEMTEASERIYNEVGNNAEIIWGTVIDDSLGKEMRVTVIATGIGSGPEASLSDRHTTHSKAANVMDFPFSNTHHYTDELEKPAFIRKEAAEKKNTENKPDDLEQKGLNKISGAHDDLDVPTYLRKGAN